MRKFMLSVLLIAGGTVFSLAQTSSGKMLPVLSADKLNTASENVTFELSKDFDPWCVQKQYDARRFNKALAEEAAKNCLSENSLLSQALARTAGKKLTRVDTPVDTVQYFTAVQSYYSGYSFNVEGGDVLSYNIGVAIDGNKVTFTNFFNLYDPNSYSSAHDIPFSGTYDPDKKTITVSTKTAFADATICGDFYGYYPAVLLCGKVGDDGKLAPDNELVFKVEGDFERITTDQAIYAYMYTADGSQSYGAQEGFKKMYIQKPTAGAKLVTMSDEVNMGKTFPNYPISKTFTIANLGNDAADLASETESDEDAFSINPSAGTIAGLSTKTFTVTFSAAKAGSYEGISTIEWEGENVSEAEPLMVHYSGTVVDYPDYSAVVLNGDMTMTTDIDYPFAVDTLANGTIVAASKTDGYGNTSSKLYVKFLVPEGKLGTFSWKGVSNNDSYWYYNAGGVFVDDEKYSAFTGANENISSSVELAPGEHVVRFQYDSYYYTGLASNRLYVYDLNLDLADLAENAAELNTPVVNLGEFIVDDTTPATGSGYITLTNKGANNLKVKKVTLTGDGANVFSVDNSVSSVPTMKTVSLPVSLEADASGNYVATAEIETTAGTFNAELKALVRDMPDFQSIVKEGDFTFTTTPSHPWLVENGMAYNSTSKVVDTEATEASFTASFTVPEGKIGILSWDGDIDCLAPEDPNNWYTSDYGQIVIHHPMNTGSKDVPGGTAKADSKTTYGSDEYWAPFLQCIPGEHYISFKYRQIGDTLYGGEDRMTIKNLSLKIMDFKEHDAELASDNAKFDSTFVGYNRYTTAKVTLNNLGSKPLKVLEIPSSGVFYGIIPTDSAQFSKTLDVTLWFYPSAPGEYKDSLTIKTNAGDFKVACEGVAKNSDDYLLVGDFEDDAYGWSIYDADKDGETWDLAYNLFGGDYPQYCHSGKSLIASASYSYYNGDITPDNWAFSPLVTIPEEGAMLTWYAAEQSKKRAGDSYSVYVATQEEISDPEQLNNLTSAFSETLDSTKVDKWSYNTIDLTPYAGKTVTICFRHHDCTGCYLLKIDDVFIWKKEAWTGIVNPATVETNGKRVLRQEYYNAEGKRLSAPVKGLNIVRTVYADGSCTTLKSMRK